MKLIPKKYLGDGVYGEFDEHGQLVLTTSNGITVTNRIVFDVDTLVALLYYLQAAEMIEWQGMRAG